MPITIQQNSFTAGELSPRLKARVDVAKYFTGCRTLENFLIFPHGGVTRRPGTEYVADAISAGTKSRLQAFQFNTQQTYALEFGQYAVHFFKDGGQIWAPSTTATASATALSQTVNHTSGGVLHVLRFQIVSTNGTVQIGTSASTTDLVGPTLLKTGWHTVEFTPPIGNTTFYLTFSGTLANIKFLSGEPVALPTSYPAADVFELDFTQSADVLYLAHNDYALCTLSRRGHQSWSCCPVSYGPSVSAPTGLVASFVGTEGATSKTYSYQVTTVIDGVESEPCDPVSLTIGNPSDGLDNSNYINLTWDAVSDADRYNVYKAWNGCYYYIGEAYNLTSPTLADNGVTPDKSATPPRHYEPFSGTDNNPAVVTFFEQRLVLARTNNKPQTIWMSKTADFLNFDKSIPVKDDDRCVFTMDADEVNAIRWVMPGQQLYIGTAAAEYYMSSSSGADPITPSNVICKRQTMYGSANIKPVQVGESVIFVSRGANKIRDLVYKWETNSLVAPDLTILSEHLFRDAKVVQLGLAMNPDPHVYVIRADGVLCVLAYMKEQDVTGWSRIVTDGEFESVCVLHGDEYDEIWCAVKRTINGATRRYIERFRPQFNADTTTDAFFVDCGATYSGTSATTVSGLDWLEGKTVKVLSDGAVHPDCLVSGGAITLNNAASTVQIGLGYASTLEPIIPDIPNQEGSSQGRISRLSRVTLRLHQSLGVLVGPDADNLQEIILRDSSMPLGQAPALFTGDKPVEIPNGYRRDGSMCIMVDDPLPTTILGLFVEASLFER